MQEKSVKQRFDLVLEKTNKVEKIVGDMLKGIRKASPVAIL